MAPLDVGADALELRVVGALAAVAVRGDHVHLRGVPVEQGLLRLRGQLLPRGVQVEAQLLPQRVHQLQEVVRDVGTAPRLDRALAQGGGRVGHHQVGVHLHPGAQPVAVRAGAERRVEGERAGLELVGVDHVLVGAGHPLGEPHLAVRVVVRGVDEVDQHQPGGQPQRGLHRVGQPSLRGRLDRQPVDDDLDRVLLLLVQGRRCVQRVRVAVDPDPREPLGLELPEQLDVLALAAADDGRQHLEPASVLQRQDAVDDLLRCLPLDRGAAGGAVRASGAGVEQPQVVVDLGDRADGRARVLRRGLLVDRHRRRQALDEVHVGLVHLPQELAGVRRQRLDVATLALGEDRVERQRGLAGPGEPREDDQGVPGQVEGDVLEVVLPGPPDDELLLHDGPWV